jgi:ATP-dependent RNA helicase RhlE
MFGGVNQKPQVAQLRQGIDILVAYQVVYLIYKIKVYITCQSWNISSRWSGSMLDMGFVRDIERIIKLVPTKRQNLMFSATFSKILKKISQAF